MCTKNEIDQNINNMKNTAPLISIRLLNRDFLALLDTGASLSFIGDEIISLLPKNKIPILPYTTPVQMASGETNCIGVIKIDIFYCHRKINQNFFLLPGLMCTIVLGRDFIINTQMSLHLAKRGWTDHHSPIIHRFKKQNENKPNETPAKRAKIAVASDNIPQLYSTLPSTHTAASLQAYTKNPSIKNINKEENIKACNEIIARSDLPPNWKDRFLRAMLNKMHLFTKKAGYTTIIEHEIDTGNAAPVRCKIRPLNAVKRAALDKCIDKLLSENIIEPCISPWLSAPVLVPKQDGDLRMCIDFRPLNNLSIVVPWPMPSTEWVLAQLGAAKYITTIDLSQGYYNIGLSPNSRDKSAFISHRGIFRFRRAAMGLKGSGFTFQRLVDKVFEGATHNYIIPYLDDLVCYDTTLEQHLIHFVDILDRLDKAGLTINYTKVQLCTKQFNFLGFLISPGLIKPDPNKVKAIMQFPPPKNIKQLQRFLGMIGFFRFFIKDLSIISKPLTLLLKKDQKWVWGELQQETFVMLCKYLSDATEIALPDMNKKFALFSDAAITGGLGGALCQYDSNGNIRPVSFASRTLTEAESRYKIAELECLSIVWLVDKFYHFLEYTKFDIITDCAALKSILSMKEPSGRIRRWCMRLMGLNCTVIHRKANGNQAADTLSRAPIQDTEPPTVNKHINNILPIHLAEEDNCLHFNDEQKADCNMQLLTIKNIGKAYPTKMYFDISDKKIWARKQLEDPEIHAIIQSVRNKTKKEIGEASTKTFYSLNKDNLLTRYIPSQKNSTFSPFKLVVPTSMRKHILYYMHDHELSGHFGIKKTLQSIQDRYTWVKMRRNITMYVKSCTKCQQIKPRNTCKSGKMACKLSKDRGLHISCDLMGPLPLSTNRKRFLFVIIDNFTRFIELYALGTATGTKVVDCLIDYCCRHGYPKSCTSDNGPQFCGKLWSDVCDKLNINHRRIVPFRPQSNMTERANKSIKSCLKMFTDTHKNWDKKLCEIAFSLRNMRNASTGYTPAFLTFGREPRSPWEIYTLNEQDTKNNNFEINSDDVLKKLESAIHFATKNAQAAYDKSKYHYDKKRINVNFAIGSLVWKELHTLSNKSKGIAGSLAHKYDGPYRVLEKIHVNNYKLVDTRNKKKTCTANVDQLRAFHPREKWAK